MNPTNHPDGSSRLGEDAASAVRSDIELFHVFNVVIRSEVQTQAQAVSLAAGISTAAESYRRKCRLSLE